MEVTVAKAKAKTTKLGSVPTPKPGGSSRDKTAMFNHLFDAKMGITAKKATKSTTKVADRTDPTVATVMKMSAKRGPAASKAMKQWLRENNTVKSAR